MSQLAYTMSDVSSTLGLPGQELGTVQVDKDGSTYQYVQFTAAVVQGNAVTYTMGGATAYQAIAEISEIRDRVDTVKVDTTELRQHLRMLGCTLREARQDMQDTLNTIAYDTRVLTGRIDSMDEV